MTFEGKNLLQYQPDKVVSELGISHVPEGRRLFGNLTVMENLQLATFARKDRERIARDEEQVRGRMILQYGQVAERVVLGDGDEVEPLGAGHRHQVRQRR